jgi:hypothetical protein
MAQVKFCSECGKKYEYSFAAPKFCSNCGKSLSRGADVSIDQRPAPSRRGGANVIEDDMTDSDFVPKIDEFEGSVEFDSNVMAMDFDPEKGFDFRRQKFEKRTKEL